MSPPPFQHLARPTLELLDPLSEFLNHGRPIDLEPQEIRGPRMPEPYRGLLVHESDMTSKLERHFGEPIALRLLERRERGNALLRQVVLVGETSARPLEYGAIRIALDRFPDEAREAVRSARRPLGAILADFDIPYASRPRLYFRLESDDRIGRVFGLERSRTLYGRQNVLSDPDGRPLAEVVEILPPLTDD